MRGLGRYYELHVLCRGEADEVTGYFLNIARIDAAVRDHVLPYLHRLLSEGSNAAAVPMGALLRRMLELLQPSLHESVRSLCLNLTPYHSLTIEADDMDYVLLKQTYEFSAAHRLHVPTLSEKENQTTFGKCNNPSGHGHNYQVEVTVRVPIDAKGQTLAVEELDAAVDEAVLQKLDHKHLNLDVPAFAKLNPSVENIVRVVFDMLGPSVARLSAKLEEVSVWETGKTVCTYRGPEA